MRIAVDNTKQRVFAEKNTVRGEYFCQACGEPVILKKGEVKIPHFAHKQQSGCTVENDMSEWHCMMQGFFPENSQEKVFKGLSKGLFDKWLKPVYDRYEKKLPEYDEETGEYKIVHRADVAIGDYILEFQNSHISLFNLIARTKYYNAIGKKVIWVFNLSKETRKGKIHGQNRSYVYNGRGRNVLDHCELNGANDLWLYLDENETPTLETKLVGVVNQQDGFKKFETIKKKTLKIADFKQQVENGILNMHHHPPKDFYRPKIVEKPASLYLPEFYVTPEPDPPESCSMLKPHGTPKSDPPESCNTEDSSESNNPNTPEPDGFCDTPEPHDNPEPDGFCDTPKPYDNPKPNSLDNPEPSSPCDISKPEHYFNFWQDINGIYTTRIRLLLDMSSKLLTKKLQSQEKISQIKRTLKPDYALVEGSTVTMRVKSMVGEYIVEPCSILYSNVPEIRVVNSFYKDCGKKPVWLNYIYPDWQYIYKLPDFKEGIETCTLVKNDYTDYVVETLTQRKPVVEQFWITIHRAYPYVPVSRLGALVAKEGDVYVFSIIKTLKLKDFISKIKKQEL